MFILVFVDFLCLKYKKDYTFQLFQITFNVSGSVDDYRNANKRAKYIAFERNDLH